MSKTLNSNKNLYTTFEYSEVKYRELTTEKEKERIEKDTLFLKPKSIEFLEKNLKEINNAKIVEVYRDKIKFQNYIGIISLEDINIEILPKFIKVNSSDSGEDNNLLEIRHNLVRMLEYTEWFGFKEVEGAFKEEDLKDLFEIFIYLFAKNLLDLLKSNRDVTYMRECNEIKCVKGKIDFKRFWNPARYHIIPCYYYDRTTNTIINRLLKYVSFLLVKKIENLRIKKLLRNILAILDLIPLQPVKLEEIQDLTFNRLNSCFEPFVDFCKLILKNSTLALQASEIEFFSFLIPMEVLFEKFIAKAFEEICKDKNSSFNIRIQETCGYLAKRIVEKEEKIFPLRPDIIIEKEDGLIIIDTKYKLLSPEDIKLGVSQQDLYQMHAYCKEIDKNNKSVRGVLIYPESLEENQKIDEILILGKEKINLRIVTISLEKVFENRNLSKDFKDKLQNCL